MIHRCKLFYVSNYLSPLFPFIHFLFPHFLSVAHSLFSLSAHSISYSFSLAHFFLFLSLSPCSIHSNALNGLFILNVIILFLMIRSKHTLARNIKIRDCRKFTEWSPTGLRHLSSLGSSPWLFRQKKSSSSLSREKYPKPHKMPNWHFFWVAKTT